MTSKAMPRIGRAVRPSDLERLKTTQATHFLYCRKCGGTYSADWSDYSFWASDAPFKCCKVNNCLLKQR